MFDRMIELYNEFMAGEVFSMVFTALFGLLMAWISYKVAGWLGLNDKWKKYAAIAGFFTLGFALLGIIPGRIIYKWYTNRGKIDEDTPEAPTPSKPQYPGP